jgi:hypothetical protein
MAGVLRRVCRVLRVVVRGVRFPGRVSLRVHC